MKKSCLILVVLLLALNVSSQISKTINVEIAGTLSSLLTLKDSSITNLIVVGNIDARDVKCIADKLNHLIDLDLGSATIQSYTGSNGTVEEVSYSGNYGANEFPSSSFWNSSTSKANTILKTIILPNNLTTIADHAFQSCTGLVSVSFPVTLNAISSFAFIGCTGLTNIALPIGLKRIPMGVFADCSHLTEVQLPEGLQYIEMYAFNSCTGLRKIYCKSSIPPSLDSYAFYGLVKNQFTVFVPIGSVQAYRSANSWAECPNITDGVSQVRNHEALGIQAYIERNTVIINGVKIGDEVIVYNTFGKLVLREKVSDRNIKFELPDRNLYFVKVANRILKLIL